MESHQRPDLVQQHRQFIPGGMARLRQGQNCPFAHGRAAVSDGPQPGCVAPAPRGGATAGRTRWGTRRWRTVPPLGGPAPARRRWSAGTGRWGRCSAARPGARDAGPSQGQGDRREQREGRRNQTTQNMQYEKTAKPKTQKVKMQRLQKECKNAYILNIYVCANVHTSIHMRVCVYVFTCA